MQVSEDLFYFYRQPHVIPWSISTNPFITDHFMHIVLSYVKMRNYVLWCTFPLKVWMIQIEKYDRYSSALTPCCGVEFVSVMNQTLKLRRS